jgi:hypothetical protein
MSGFIIVWPAVRVLVATEKSSGLQVVKSSSQKPGRIGPGSVSGVFRLDDLKT